MKKRSFLPVWMVRDGFRRGVSRDGGNLTVSGCTSRGNSDTVGRSELSITQVPPLIRATTLEDAAGPHARLPRRRHGRESSYGVASPVRFGSGVIGRNNSGAAVKGVGLSGNNAAPVIHRARNLAVNGTGPGPQCPPAWPVS